jgi:putative protein-disulfide isomerase
VKQFLLILSSLFATVPEYKSQSQPELIYVYDALCGWCFAFSPVMKQVEQKYADSLKISVISGGLAIGSNAGPIGRMSAYIKGAIPRVEQLSGVKFGEPYKVVLDEGSRIFDSEKPAIALALLKSHHPDKAVEMAHALQHLVFVEGKDLNNDTTYFPIIKQYKLNKHEFIEALNDPANREKAYAEFRLAAGYGATGFPTVLLKYGPKVTVLSSGFTNFDQIDRAIQEQLEQL